MPAAGSAWIRAWLAGALMLLHGLLTPATGLAESSTNLTAAGFAARAQNLFVQAQERQRAKSSDAEAAWQFARAAFDWAEFATNDTQRAALAQEAIEVCRPLIAREPRLAPAHYYLAMNLGQLARTKSLGALKLVTEMERHFQEARELEPHLDQAGPDRSLGLLYLDAPGWPTSLGSRNKARQHLQRAIELAPDFPENRLCFLEALVKWGEKKNAQRAAKDLPDLLKQARTNLTGEAWASAWADWDRRWLHLQKKLKEATPSRR